MENVNTTSLFKCDVENFWSRAFGYVTDTFAIFHIYQDVSKRIYVTIQYACRHVSHSMGKQINKQTIDLLCKRFTLLFSFSFLLSSPLSALNRRHLLAQTNLSYRIHQNCMIDHLWLIWISYRGQHHYLREKSSKPFWPENIWHFAGYRTKAYQWYVKLK